MSKYQEALKVIDKVLSNLPSIHEGKEMDMTDLDLDHDGYEYELQTIKELVDKETQGQYYERVNSLEQIKTIETRDEKSSFTKGFKPYLNEYWTTQQPLLAVTENGRKIAIDKWFINSQDELIYSDKNDFLNLRMYLGLDKPTSYIKHLYIL